MENYNGNTVEVFSDRPYTIITINDGQVVAKNYQVNNLDNLIDFIKLLDELEDKVNVICLACCYKQYVGSFNVQVDISEQKKRLIKYGSDNYATFHKNVSRKMRNL